LLDKVRNVESLTGKTTGEYIGMVSEIRKLRCPDVDSAANRTQRCDDRIGRFTNDAKYGFRSFK